MKILLKNAYIIKTEDDGSYKIIKGHLGIDGKKIDYIGEELPTGYDEVKDMDDHILMPGLVNTHTHTAMTLLRGIGSDLPLKEWLFDNMMPVEDKMTAEDIVAGGALALLEMIKTGTTSFSDMYMFPMDMAELCIEAGIKANLCRPVLNFDAGEIPHLNERWKESIELFEKYHMAEDGLIRIDFSLHAEYTSTPHMVEAYAKECKKRGARMHLHLSETESEHELCIEKHGKTPAAYFNHLGVFDSPTCAAHCVCITDDDMDIFRKKSVSVMHNPTSNLKLGSGVARIPEMIEKGINVALGTDGAASNNNLNMLEELHIASILHNGIKKDTTIMNAETMLKIATRNGAKLQGREDTGDLCVGKCADIVAVSIKEPHMFPALNHVALICYSAQGSDVAMTMVDGKILYESGKFLTLDEAKVIDEAKKSVKRLYE